MQRPEPALDDLTRQEIALHEGSDRPADAILAHGNDRCVRDRNAERVAKEGGHGKPVCDSAHHRRLRRGPNETDPRITRLEQSGDDEHDRRQDQQTRGARLHLIQLPLSLDFVRNGGRLR